MHRLTKDEWIEIMLASSYDTIVSLCHTNKYINNICQDDYFWQLKFRLDFPMFINLIQSQETNWKKLYQRFYLNQVNILKRLNIHTKKDYYMWLLKNHPDKGGSRYLTQMVIREAKQQGW